MSIENRFDIPLVAGLALKEKQIQQNYRPIIAVHKWFARRPGSLFRALALSEFGDAPLSDLYFTANDMCAPQLCAAMSSVDGTATL
jgi:putative DNA methylase